MQEEREGAQPNAGEQVYDRYCGCLTDVLRRNYRKTGDVMKSTMSASQKAQCESFGYGAGASAPFAFDAPKESIRLSHLTYECVDKSGAADHDGIMCGCVTDGTVAALKTTGRIADDDYARCKTADAYYAATKSYLTVRQFRAIGLAQLTTSAAKRAKPKKSAADAPVDVLSTRDDPDPAPDAPAAADPAPAYGAAKELHAGFTLNK